MKNGTQIVMEFRESSSPRGISGNEVKTLHDLLEVIKVGDSARSQRSAMLRSTVAHLSRFLGQPPGNIRIGTLTEALRGFKAYLKGRRFAPNSIRSYINYYKLLIRQANELGWNRNHVEIANEWQPILTAVKRRKCGNVVQYAIRRHLKPSEFSDEDFDEMVRSMLADGRRYRTVTRLKRNFVKGIQEENLGGLLPRLSPLDQKFRYGIPLHKFPAMLRDEILKMLDWKLRPFEDDRPKGGRLRPVTADGLSRFLCQAYGYARNVKRCQPRTLDTLLSKEILGEYLNWSITERGVKPSSLVPRLSMIRSIVRTYPALADKDLKWIGKRLAQIQEQQQEEGESSIERKAQKSIEYELLADIPRRIGKEIKELKDLDTRRKAILRRDQLLIHWLRVLPWRQRNIRELTLGKQEQTTSLFKGEIPPYSTVPRAKWVEDILKQNPRAEFWQVIAYPSGNKTRRRIHMILPKQLVAPLEEYLATSRPVLVGDHDPRTLLVNDHGGAYSKHMMHLRTTEITLRYVGKRVNPHLIRDIVAFDWLKKHPGDYLTVQKLLWHTKLETTIRVYGHDFNEAYAVCRVEEYLDEQKNDVERR